MSADPKNADHDDDQIFGYDPDPRYGPPLWVKVFAVIGLIVVAAIVVMLASGHHGPGRHL